MQMAYDQKKDEAFRLLDECYNQTLTARVNKNFNSSPDSKLRKNKRK